MLNLIVIIAVAIAGAAVSRHYPTEELLQDRFDLGQTYYAAQDHGNAVRVFRDIEATPSYALLDVDAIMVTIGDLTMPLRHAATYQLGNSYRNVGRNQLERSEHALADGDIATSEVRRQEAREAFDAAVVHYRNLIESPEVSQELRSMAQYQVIRALFQMGDFADIAAEVAILRRRFPGSAYEQDAIYDQGWAEYHNGRYDDAIDTFAELLQLTQDPIKRDRAIFQTGESHFAQRRYEAARAEYRRLVGLYDFGAMSDRQLRAMRTERLRGLVQETTRELVAKAQIRIGDAFGEEERLEEAVNEYQRVPQRYPEETELVQRSYENMAALLHEVRGANAGIAVLRRAIEQVADSHFRGRAQFRIARTLYAEGRYEEALEDLAVYRRAYGDIALHIGVTLDRVHFLMGESQRLLGDRQQGRGPEAEARYAAAMEHYRQVLSGDPRGPHRAEAHFGLALVHNGVGAVDSAMTHLRVVADQYQAAPVAPFALSWQGRLLSRQEDYAAAVAAFLKLIAQYPDSELVDPAWRDLGLVYKETGRPEKALDAFRQVGAASPFWSKVQAEAGDLLISEKRIETLETEFDMPGALQRALDDDDVETAAELHYILGRTARERRDNAGEIEHLSQALALSQNPQLGSFCLFFRGLAYYRLGSALDAAGDTLTAAAQFAASIHDLERLLQEGGTAEMRSVAYRTRGVALTRLGRSAEAVENYRILIAAAPTPEERSDYELMLMELFYDLGRLPDTATAARHIIQADFVDDADAGFYKRERAYLVLVSVLLEKEEYQETVGVARQAMARYPASGDLAILRLAIARALFSDADYAAASTALQQYLEHHPGHHEAVSAYYQLGYAHELLGNYDKAAMAFGSLAERHPGAEVAPEALYRSGENLYNANNLEEALDRYNRVIQRYPDSEAAAKAMYSAAWTLLDLERPEVSMAAMGELVEKYPDSDYARFAQFTLGDYAYSQQRLETAREAYRVVVELFPGTLEADRALGLMDELTEDIASREYQAAFADLDQGRFVSAVEGFEAVYTAYPETYSGLAALANKAVAQEKLGDNRGARETYGQVIEITSERPETEAIAEFARLRLANL